MVTLNFQVPLNESGLHVMAHKTGEILLKIDPKRQPKLFTAYQMMLEAIENERAKLKKRK
jgi:hypothetical protein